VPASIYAGQPIVIARSKSVIINDIPFYTDPASYPYRHRITVWAAGVNFIRVGFGDPTPAFPSAITNGDTLLLPGGAIPISGATFSLAAGLTQINMTGDFTAFGGQSGWVFGPHQPELYGMVSSFLDTNGVVQSYFGVDGFLNTNGFLRWAGRARVSTQFDKTSDTTLANVTGLSVNLAAGTTYSFRAVLYVSANASGGAKVAVSGTATLGSLRYRGKALSGTTLSATGQATALGTAVAGATAAVDTIEIDGTITTNAAGTLTIQFAQNASFGTASSVLVGSHLIVHEMP
jgi:hypothetical protein